MKVKRLNTQLRAVSYHADTLSTYRSHDSIPGRESSAGARGAGGPTEPGSREPW